MRVLRLDAARVRWLTPRDPADAWRLALGEAGYLTRPGDDPVLDALRTIQEALDRLEIAEAELSANMRLDPGVAYKIPLAVYPFMAIGLLLFWSVSMSFAGPTGVVRTLALMVLGAGVVVWLGFGWQVSLKRAWSRRDHALLEERDRRRVVLHEAVGEANGRSWVGVIDGIRIVSAPDIDWLRACRRRLLESRPKASADRLLKAEAERIEDAVATARDPAALQTDRAHWIALLAEAGVEPP